MMAKYEPLDRIKHERLRVGVTRRYDMFRETTLVPIIIDEVAQAAREYPIIVPDQKDYALCILSGIKPNQNAFVDDSGQWRADYIPMDIGRHPFGLYVSDASTGQKSGSRYTLCIDPDATEFEDLEGELLFQQNGDLAEIANKKIELAKRLISKRKLTQNLIREIDAAGLLTRRSIKLNVGHEISEIQGFKIVDEKKLNTLSDEDFVILRNKGLLPLIYAQLLSMANFRQGRLTGQIKTKPESNVTETKTTVDLDTYWSDDGDLDISFN